MRRKLELAGTAESWPFIASNAREYLTRKGVPLPDIESLIPDLKSRLEKKDHKRRVLEFCLPVPAEVSPLLKAFVGEVHSFYVELAGKLVTEIVDLQLELLKAKGLSQPAPVLKLVRKSEGG
jgi:hypothetical protein